MDKTDLFLELCKSVSTDDKVFGNKFINKRERKGSFKVEVKAITEGLNHVSRLFDDNYDDYSNFGLYSIKIGGNSLTDEERDELDEEVADLLAGTSKQIENLRQKIGKNAAVEGSFQQFKQVVIQCLSESHAEVSKAWGDLQLLRMKRVLASRPNLYTRNDKMASEFGEELQNDYAVAEEQDRQYDEEYEIDADFKAELELENEALSKHLEEQLTGAVQAERQLAELSQLLSVFNEKLTTQRDMVEKMVEESKRGNENVRKGNIELHKTDERYTNDMQIFLAFIIASLLLLIYDW